MPELKFYYIDSEQVEKLECLMRRLYTENRMDGDEMLYAAQLIDSILRNITDWR